MQILRAILKRTIAGVLAALIIIGVMMCSNAVTAQAATNCNPVSFLESVWQDLLGRDITRSEKTFFLDFLSRGGTDAQVALLVLNGAEYRTKLVQSLYQQFLGRAASQPEINFFLTALQQGATVEQILAVIVGSNEYYQNRGGGTTDGFLEQLYQDLLGRPLDDVGMAFFTSQLDKGGTRLQVAQFILVSSEYRSGQIRSFLKIFLEREASGSELNFFLALWQQGARREQILAQILGSPEYCELAGHPSHGRRP